MDILQVKIMIINSWDYIKQLMIDVSEYILKAIIFVALFFEDIKFIVIAMMVLIGFDQITGVWKVVRQHTFEWKKFNRLYTKLILYILALMATYILEKQIINTDAYPFTKGLAIIIGSQELISIYINISDITGKKYIKEYVDTVKNKLSL